MPLALAQVAGVTPAWQYLFTVFSQGLWESMAPDLDFLLEDPHILSLRDEDSRWPLPHLKSVKFPKIYQCLKASGHISLYFPVVLGAWPILQRAEVPNVYVP